MEAENVTTQYLLSLPPRMAELFEELEGRRRPGWFATSDPGSRKLGSGGGTANVLANAWRATNPATSFYDWLTQSKKLIIHSGGKSRRLPAYAAVGKILMPIPVFRWSRGQRLTQTLLDLQLPAYERVLAHAPPALSTMVTSGDVLLRFGRDLPKFPEADVLGLGMWVRPEIARDFGVFFCARQRPGELAFYLQKPVPAKLRQLSSEYLYLVDTGMWLLSKKAVEVLLARCGWNNAKQGFADDAPAAYELYGQFGLALGQSPVARDPEVNALRSAVVPLPNAEFYHFGASRQMIESISALQNLELDETKLGLMGAKRHPDQYLQNSRFEFPLRLEENHTLWVENSTVPKTWRLACDHVLTGVPGGQWNLRLERGVCIDFVPIGQRDYCVRAYGIDDSFSGQIGRADTNWLGRPAQDWLSARGISWDMARIDPETDIQKAQIFPVLSGGDFDRDFLEWICTSEPAKNNSFAERWCELERLSGDQICQRIELRRLYNQRSDNLKHCLAPMMKNYRWSVFFKLDLESTARLFAETDSPLPPPVSVAETGLEPMALVREQMFRAAVLRHRKQDGWQANEQQAFEHLRSMLVRYAQLTPVLPQCCVLQDQIVWGRSPVRLDLAGGWTDTPPYCLENGGRVVNLAVDLNGQPPIQVFAKLSERPELVVRSIDLGAEQRITSYNDLETQGQPGSEFGLAKAAFALAGFLPRFHAHGGFNSLAEQLKAFGGGIEVSLLAAVPKGSGLGTSSILAATLLATLSELCGLNWDKNVLFSRTLALEQMLTTGGGWQDQAGGIFRGFKLIETAAGLAQKPTMRWLPDHLVSDDNANKTVLLYYTGMTRLAKRILHEIVRGIFLNSSDHLRIVGDIGANAEAAFNAAQKDDYQGLIESVRTSWQLNQRLDPGTNTPEVQQILDPIQDYLDATKLLGAGGGGYLIMFAKDHDAARRIRQTLQDNPPNGKSRFVDFNLSDTGLQLTRS